MSAQSALSALLWSSTDTVEGEEMPLDLFDPSSSLVDRISEEWEMFKDALVALGFEPENERLEMIDPSQGNYWDYVAHDWIMTRNRHGVGFWDGGWREDWVTRLCAMCDDMGEIEIYYNSEDGLVYAD